MMINLGLGVVLTLTDIVFGAVALLPLVAFVVWLLAELRILAGRTPREAWRKSVAEVGIVCGTFPWVWLTMMPGSGAGVVPGRVSLVPFRDLETMSDVQVIGNLLVLAAIGFFAPLRFRWLATLPRMLLVGVACSALIESAQYLLMLDRVSSVDDILLNATGCVLAALLSRPWWVRVSNRSRATDKELSVSR